MFRCLLKARLRREAAKNKDVGDTSEDSPSANAADASDAESARAQSDSPSEQVQSLTPKDSNEEQHSTDHEEIKETAGEASVSDVGNELRRSTDETRSVETLSPPVKRSQAHFVNSAEKRSKTESPSLTLITSMDFSVPPPPLGTVIPNVLSWPAPICDNSASAFDRVKRAVTPLADVPLEKQLELKQETVQRLLAVFKSEILVSNGAAAAWFRSQERKLGSFLQVDKMRPSPRSDHYRSKCECTIGIDPDTNLLAVGFVVEPKTSRVGPIYHLRHIPATIKSIVRCFEGFLRNLEVAPYDPVECRGHWISLSVRVTECGESMVVLALDTRAMDLSRVKEIKERVATFVQDGLGQGIRLNSCYLRTRGANRSSNPELLFGEATIREKLLGRQFRISPGAYFPVNVGAAEMCCDVVADCAALDFNCSLVDVCCGTGSIGLSLSSRCGQMIGLDELPEAVQDARMNALNNDATNCEFFSGSAEEYLGTLWRRLVFDQVVCIVDPPRGGIGAKAFNHIRKNENVKKVVFVSNDPRSTLRCCVDLCRPPSNAFRGEPFMPVRAFPVDTFPHTNNFSLILSLERVTMSTLLHASLVEPEEPTEPVDKEPATTTQETEGYVSPEQIRWLDYMSGIYGDRFERQGWTRAFIRQNEEVAQAQSGQATARANIH